MSFNQRLGGFMPRSIWLFRLMSKQRGRNSVVECHLPKVDAVGSNPIARSIFYPLVSIFVFLTYFGPSVLLAQVSADNARPFGQGNVVSLPATSAYLGDLPHSINVISDDYQSHTIGGVQT